jgi:hypothetical protein
MDAGMETTELDETAAEWLSDETLERSAATENSHTLYMWYVTCNHLPPCRMAEPRP